jgi:hypothetical protein
MHTTGQWFHQHDFLLGGATILTAIALFLVYRRSRIHWWLPWASLLSAFVASLFALRTPDATILRPPNREGLQTADASIFDVIAGATGGIVRPNYEEVPLGDVEAIDRTIRSAGKPVLVEIYADFGFS